MTENSLQGGPPDNKENKNQSATLARVHVHQGEEKSENSVTLAMLSCKYCHRQFHRVALESHEV